jgi:hypothetical protein
MKRLGVGGTEPMETNFFLSTFKCIKGNKSKKEK